MHCNVWRKKFSLKFAICNWKFWLHLKSSLHGKQWSCCVQYSLASLCTGKLWVCSFFRGKVTSPIQVAEVGKIFLTRAFLKEIFAVSNSGARGNCGKHLFRGKYIAINVTQILFLAESKLCSKSDSFQNVINLFHSSTTRKLVPNFKLWMFLVVRN